MDNQLPTTEMVIENGQPIWLVSGAGIEVRHPGGRAALELFHRECKNRGLLLPGGGEQPRRGPTEVDEPGV
jgi:hypothetical protein